MADEMIEKTKNAIIDYDSSKVEKTKVVSVSAVIALSFTVTLKDDSIAYISGVILRGGVEAGRVTIDLKNGFYNVSFNRFTDFSNEERKLIQTNASDSVEAFLNDVKA